MAITVMRQQNLYDVLPANVRAVRDYPGAEQGVVHSKRCRHHTDRTRTDEYELQPDCVRDRLPYSSSVDYRTQEPCCFRGPLYMVTTHVGLVLSVGEHNYYDDSDFYAVVWNEAEGRPREIQYATTRGWTYPNHAEVDATPETLAKYKAWIEAEREKRRLAREAEEAARREVYAAQTAKLNRFYELKGRTFTVGKGKKAYRGELFWVGRAKTGHSVRCGVRLADSSVKWVSADSLTLEG